MEKKSEEIWRYIPLSQFALPKNDAATALRGLRRLWKSIRSVGIAEDAEQPSYERAQRDDLQDLLPRFDPEPAADALAEALADWPRPKAYDTTRVVVGPPGSFTGEVISALAKRKGWNELTPPPRAHLLKSEATEPGPATVDLESSEPQVIARLERWLLRNDRGLPVLRAWLEKLRLGGGPLLIGCDSWTWSFLEHTFGVGDLAGEPLIPAAVDGSHLMRWLGPPLTDRGRTIRSTEHTEEVVFAPPDDSAAAQESTEQEPKIPATLLKLAGASRGNPGVILELWRRSLRLAKDGPSPAETGQRPRVLWAASLRESEIDMPHQLEAIHEYILHATLLHGGLEEDLLPEVLPFPPHELARRTRDLCNRNLLAVSDGELTVPLAAYTAVREYLRSEGYLVDAF